MTQKSGNILFADDEPMIIKGLEMYFEDISDETYKALNGKEVLEVLDQGNEIHCIVCDINMPVMTGFELLEELRSRNINIPFIFYSAHGNKELMDKASKYQVFDFINKPDLDSLEESVSRGLKKGITGDDSISAFDEEFKSQYHLVIGS